MKRGFTYLLIFALILVVLNSCKMDSEVNESTTIATTTTNGTSLEEEQIYPDLPEEDFGGYEFKMMAVGFQGADEAEWIPRDVVSVGEENGDVINDAVYRRNAYVEDKYNVKIVEVKADRDAADKIKASVMAQDNAYDVVMPRIFQIMSIAEDGYLTNLYDVPHLDLKAPWYDSNSVETLTIGDKLFFVVGDLMIISNDATPAFLFNKKVLEDNALPNPYDLVQENKWTFDTVTNMMKDITRDINGNGELDMGDQWAMITQGDSLVSFFHSAGGRMAEKDSDNIPQLTFDAPKNVEAALKAFSFMYHPDYVINLHQHEGKDAPKGIYNLGKDIFRDDRALFMWIRMRIVESLREMQTEFGILPVPKGSPEDEYAHTVNRYTGAAICIPNQPEENLERTGIILEALSAESKYTLQKAYYDINLTSKFVRDEESEEMLDIILSTRTYDIGEIYDFGGIGFDFLVMSKTNNEDFTTFYDKHREKAQVALDKTIENHVN
ncbi:MAG: extracellular solute-binding protein [Eubacteriales bacterium]